MMAVDTNSPTFDGVSMCISAISTYSSAARDALLASQNTEDSLSLNFINRCFGQGSCLSVAGQCLASWSCTSCLPAIPPTKCVRAGCQRELCVAQGTPKSPECDSPSYQLACYEKAICDVDENGSCGWRFTDEYNKCVSNPVEDYQTCNTRDPCKCFNDTQCTWCVSPITLTGNFSGVQYPIGRCMPKSMAKKCLAPQFIGGFGGSLVENTTCNETITDALFNQIESADFIELRFRVLEEIANRTELDNIAVFFVELLGVQRTNNNNGGLVKSIIRVESESRLTDEQMKSLCDAVTIAIMNATAPAGFGVQQCQLLEITDGNMVQQVLTQKRQSSTTLSTVYLLEFEANNINRTSNTESSMANRNNSPLLSASIIMLVPLLLLLIQ